MGAREIKNGRTRRTEERALVAGWEKTGAPVKGPALHALAVAQDNITWKILAFTAQPVGDPGASARKARARDACVNLIESRYMIVRFAVEGLDEREIVDVFRHVRVLLTNPCT